MDQCVSFISLVVTESGFVEEVGEGVQRDWGGYSGYFADPDGFGWEVACNPREIGQSVLP